MAAGSTIFPIFLRAEYREDANGVPKLISRIQQAAKISEAEMKRVGVALNSALSAPRATGGGLDLGIKQLRDLIQSQQQAAAAAREVANATKSAAIANSDLRAALMPSVRGYFDLAKAKEADVAASRVQLTALQAVQAELDRGTSAVKARLQAEQNLANFRKTANINEGALRLAAGQASVDRAALSGATLESVLGRTRASNQMVEQQTAQQAAAAKAAAAAQDQLAQSAARLMAQINPLVAAQQRYDAALAEANRLLQAGAISTQQFAQAQTFAAAQLQRVRDDVTGVAAAQERLRQEQGRAAMAAREQAAAVAALKAQINPAAAAQDQFNQKVAFAKAALDRGELSQMEYARAVRLASAALREAGQAEVAATAARNGLTVATRQGTTARKSVINSVGSERTAFIQLGQQMQDMTVQAQMGTNAFIIMGQQLPQVAFALSGLEGSANKTKAAVGGIATFLAGPWGAAIFVGLAVLGPFVQKLFEAGEAADVARVGADSLAQAQSVLGGVFDETSGKIKTQNELLVLNARLTALNLQSEALAKRASAASTFRNAQSRGLGDRFFGGGGVSDSAAARVGVAPRRSTGQNNAAEARGLLEGVFSGRISADEALKRSAKLDFSGTGATREEFQQAIIDRAFSRDAERVAKLINESLDSKQLSPELRKAGGSASRSSGQTGGRSGGGASGELQQLARFGEQAFEQILRINDRFSEQTRLIQQSLQATRQLDDIIGETNAKMAEAKNLTAGQREEFERIKTAAEQAKTVIEDALQRPFEDLRLESERRLEIEQLLAQGRVDEAAGLREVLRIEQQLGEESRLRNELDDLILAGRKEEAAILSHFLDDYAMLKDEARDRVIAEQRLTRELRAQAELLELQSDVARTVANDLRSILSGRSTDFFGNFKQALDDLRGARLFEDLFGPAFRELEEELRGNTPQGRANARYTAEVEKTAATTSRVEESFANLADAADDAAVRLRGGGTAANDNGGFNPQMAIAQAALQAAGIGTGITVSGTRARPTEIATKSTKDIADRIAKATVDGFLGPLEDLLGPQFAAQLGGVLSGALAGFVRGGEAGAVLGGLGSLSEEIFGKDSKITKGLGKALDGAETGTQIDGIIKAIGIRGSGTGAQIGGAIGSAIPIPGAAQVGAAIGSIIGGLLKGTPRGSATIGGTGGGLGITGVVGNRGSLKDTATGLAGSVLAIIDDLAQQLGATVNAGAGSVSIGQRKDSIRVDPRGGGATKISNGAIDFGEDAEAAVAFAVQNLIQDGVITGLRASENRLLQAGKDIDAAIRDVLTFRSVFDRLKEIKDPLGFAVDQLNREFEGLIDLFERAGASTEEFAELEELYNLQRAEAIKDATDRVAGSLRQLLSDLTIGDSGLSLRSRRANALGEFNELADRVAAGDTSAFDDFAEISQQLLEIERALFGSTQSYFDRLSQITALTEQAIAGQENVTGIGSAAPSPFDDRVDINRSIDIMNSDVSGWLRAINDNLIALNPEQRTGGGGGSGGGFGSPILNAYRFQNF